MMPRILPPRYRQRGFYLPWRGPAGGNDPYFSFVVQLAHFDGSNGATTFVSTVGGNFQQQGAGPVLSTTQKKFGTTALRNNGTNYVASPTHASYAIGSSNDFVIEGFTYCDNVTGAKVIFDMRSSNPTVAPAFYTNGTTLNYQYATSTPITSASVISAATWFYWAIARASGTTRLYGGAASGSTVSSLGSFSDTQNYVQGPINLTAAWNNSSNLAGYVDEFRFSVGTARGYTGSTIPVPTAAFPDS